MRARVQRWGNSLALRIPQAIAQETDLQEGVEVEIAARRGKLVVRRTAPRYELGDLLAKITKANIHEETWVEPPKGREIW